jgi:hypothetical protein
MTPRPQPIGLRRQAAVTLLLLLIAATSVAPRPASAHDFYGVTSRGALAVAVGDSGRFLVSTQAPHTTWHLVPRQGIPFQFRGVSTSAVGFSTAGQHGRVYRNADGSGERWSSVSTGTVKELYGMSHVGNRIVAVGDSGTAIMVFITADGAIWTRADTVATLRALRAVAGGTTYGVAVGDNGTILWSFAANPVRWLPAASVPTPLNLRGTAEGPSHRFYAVGDDGIVLRSSADPSTEWQRIALNATTENLNAITFFGFLGLAVGDHGTILYSNGGDAWSRVDSPTTYDLNGISYTGSGEGGRFVAVGDSSTVIWSTLGTVWESGVVTPTRSTSWGSIRGRWGEKEPDRK